jgi:hypothetical protein
VKRGISGSGMELSLAWPPWQGQRAQELVKFSGSFALYLL